MSAATETKAQSPTPQSSEALNRLSSLPLISSSVSYAQETINAYPLTAKGYQLGESVFNSGLKAAQPFTTRLQPQLAVVDSWAVQGLDFAQSKWAYPFKATPTDVYNDAKAPVDQGRDLISSYAQALIKAYDDRVVAPAKGLYDARVAPVYDQATAQFQELKAQNAYLARATEIVENLQKNLSSTVDNLSARGKADGDAATRKAQGLSNALFAELDRVRAFALSLPTESHKRVQPVLSTFSETYERLSKEARDTSVSPSTRFANVLKFVREQSLPALQKAIVHPESTTTAVPQTNGVTQ